MTVTIKDIAKKAGVSFSTVSKALRDSPLVTEKTKKQILQIAEEMNYQPNNAARSLVSKKTWCIGVVWPSLERLTPSILISRINEMLEKHAYTTLLSINQVELAIETFHRFKVDAVLVFDDQQTEIQGRKLDSNLPVLYYGISNSQPYPTIDANRSRAIELAVSHLLELNHQRIAYIGDVSTKDQLQKQKVDTFIERMKAEQLPVKEEMIVITDNMDSYDGYSAAKRLLSSTGRPTAMISGSYDLTRGILKAANELSITVPDQLSIISYDHIPQMEELDVPMTAVGVPIDKIANKIAQVLLDIAADRTISDNIFLEPEIAIRRSTALCLHANEC